MQCPNCGYQNPPEGRSCGRCGALLTAPVPSQPARPSTEKRAASPLPSRPGLPAGQKSPLASLSRLGISLSLGQVMGIIAGVLAGLIVARLLPYIYPLFTARLLDSVFGPGVSPARDGFNANFMTACTCTSSFAVALLASLVFRLRKRSKP